MLRSTFSTTTIASSTTMPIASTRPNSDRLLSEKPNRLITKKVPTSETGIATIGMIGRAPGLQEQDHHQHDQHDRLDDGLDHGVDRLLDELGRIVDDGVLQPVGEALRQLVHRRLDLVGGRERVRAGQLEDRERDRRIAIEVGVGGIVDRGELDARDVLDAHHRVRALLHHDLAEFLRVDQAAERAHRELERARLRHRRLVQHAGRDLHVLPLQRVRDVAGGERRATAAGRDRARCASNSRARRTP